MPETMLIFSGVGIIDYEYSVHRKYYYLLDPANSIHTDIGGQITP